MNTITVDTSVLIAVIVGEKEKNKIIQLTEGAELITPLSVHWEIGNAFSAMLKRHLITIEEALVAIEIYQQIPIRFVDVELSRSLERAGKENIYAYDAYLLQCAEKYHTPLLTLDKHLAQIAKKRGVSVPEI